MFQFASRDLTKLVALIAVLFCLSCDKRDTKVVGTSSEPTTDNASNLDGNVETKSETEFVEDFAEPQLVDLSKGHNKNKAGIEPDPVVEAMKKEIQKIPSETEGDPDSDNVIGLQAEPRKEVHPIDIPENWTRLSKVHEIWIDKTAREVIVGGFVCLTLGPLEMFVCPEGTKEHESVVSARALASEVHACLQALGADPGAPTQWDPNYSPARGPAIDVKMIWKDEQSGETKTANGRDWVRHMSTGKPLEHQWVFGGSALWKDPDTGQEIYYGDGGELICVSNFSTATIDLNVQSTESNSDLAYEAFTENIPPRGTKVYVVIKPGKVIGKEPTAVPSEKVSQAEKKESTPDQ